MKKSTLAKRRAFARFLRVKDYAERIGVSERTLRQWIYDKVIPVIKVRDHLILIDLVRADAPGVYINAAREVMGGIDLDPASCAEANEVVGAAEFFDAESDGLTQHWKGRVWMNPPYSTMAQFCEKLLESPDVKQAVVLTNNSTDTQWFQKLANRSVLLCFHSGRIKFWHPYAESFTPLQGQVFFYFGSRPHRFEELFGQFGLIVKV